MVREAACRIVLSCWAAGELKHLDSARADNKLKLAGLQDLVRGLERSQTEFKEHARQLELELQKSHQVVVSKEARVGELEAQCQRSQDALASSSDALRTLERQSKIEQQLVAKKQARLLEMESQHTRDQKVSACAKVARASMKHCSNSWQKCFV